MKFDLYIILLKEYFFGRIIRDIIQNHLLQVRI